MWAHMEHQNAGIKIHNTCNMLSDHQMVFNLIHWSSEVIFANLTLHYLSKICLQNLTVNVYFGKQSHTVSYYLQNRGWTLERCFNNRRSSLKSSSELTWCISQSANRSWIFQPGGTVSSRWGVCNIIAGFPRHCWQLIHVNNAFQ